MKGNNQSSGISTYDDHCFVLFSRHVNKFALQLKKELQGTCDYFLLTYAENDKQVIDELDTGIKKSVYNKNSLKERFSNYTPKFNRENWKIMPGNLDLCQLRFIQDHPGYTHYWFCEDDVRYTGQFAALIDELSVSTADLLATNRKSIVEGWWHKNSFRAPVGDQVGEITPTENIFLPFFRISKKGAETIQSAYEKGWAGHHEVSWLSILEYHGLQVADINSLGRQYYTSNPNKLGMGPGTFIYSPPKLIPGLKRNMLYHPVKPFGEYFKRQKKRFKAIIKNSLR